MFSRMIMALFILVIMADSIMAEETRYTLTGRIMDTSDNWLPDVRVALKRARGVTHTDGNGLFTLSFTNNTPLSVDEKKVYEYIDLDKDGYQGRTVEIKDLSIFNAPIIEKLEPNAVGKDNIGFSTRMSMSHSIHKIQKTLDSKEDGQLITEEVFNKALSRYESAIPQGETDRVWFHIYVPKGGKTLKAAFLISLHGMGSIDDPVLRAFADENAVALVGVLGNPVQRGCYPVSLLDEHMKKLAQLANHPELTTIPVFTFGHSNGTGFATLYAAQRPDRVIAWISYHSGWSFHLQFPGLEKVPGLVMHGQKDEWLEHGQEQTVKNLRLRRQAPVALMLEGNVGHGPVNTSATWAFITDFCKAAMRIRLAENGILRPVILEQGWLGANYDRALGGQQKLDISPYDQYAGDRNTANWLPDKSFAETWQRYGNTDPRSVK